MQRRVQQCEEADVPLIRPGCRSSELAFAACGHATISELTSMLRLRLLAAAAPCPSGQPHGMGDDNFEKAAWEDRKSVTCVQTDEINP